MKSISGYILEYVEMLFPKAFNFRESMIEKMIMQHPEIPEFPKQDKDWYRFVAERYCDLKRNSPDSSLVKNLEYKLEIYCSNSVTSLLRELSHRGHLRHIHYKILESTIAPLIWKEHLDETKSTSSTNQ